MLYDPKWEETTAPVKEGWKIILQDAANILRQYGWVKNRVGNPVTGFCMVGAMLQAVAVREGSTLEGRLEHYINNPDYRKARKKLDRTVPVSSTYWNDSVACTVDQVIAKLEDTANAV